MSNVLLEEIANSSQEVFNQSPKRPLNAVGFYETLGFEKQREIDASGPDTPEITSVELTKQLS